MVARYAERRVVAPRLRRAVREAHAVYVEAHSEVLKLAFAVVVAGGAVAAVVGEQQFEYHLAVFAQPLRVRPYLHALFRRRGAGGIKSAPFVLDHAHTACAVNRQFRVVAEGRELDARLAYDFEDVFLSRYLDGDSVYRHIFFLFHRAIPPSPRGTGRPSRRLRI